MHWLREYHAVVAGFPRESRRWRFVERALQPGEIVCHHDSAMYNMAFDGDDLAGVFDWDVAGPGIPLDDIAIFAWNTAVLFPDAPMDEVAHVLRTIADGYGGIDPHALLDHVVTRMTDAANRIAAAQDAGDPGMLRLGTVGEPAATRARLAALGARLPELHAALDAG